MKKLVFPVLFVILLINPFSTFAQTENETEPPAADTGRKDTAKISKVDVGIILRPEYCYRSITAQAAYQAEATALNASQAAKLGSTVGLNFNIKISKRFSIETGVLLSNIGYKANNVDTLGVASTTNTALNTTDFTYSFHYFSIPVKLNINLQVAKKAFMFISAGVQTSVLMTEYTEEVYNSSGGTSSVTTKTGIFGYYNVDLFFTGGLGIDYYISPKSYLKIEPIYSFALRPDAPATQIKETLFSAGLDLGLYFNM